MVSHKGFRTLGYVYAILSILGVLAAGTIRTVLMIGAKNVDKTTLFASLLSNLIGLIFPVILLVGIVQNKLILVKIYRVFFIVINVIGLILIVIVIVAFIGLKIFSDEGKNIRGISIFGLLLLFAIGIGLFKLILWIVNGVIAAIQHEQGADIVVMCEPNENIKPNNPYYAQV